MALRVVVPVPLSAGRHTSVLTKRGACVTVVLEYRSLKQKTPNTGVRVLAVHNPTRRVKLRTCGLPNQPRASCPRLVGQVQKRVMRPAGRCMYRSIYCVRFCFASKGQYQGSSVLFCRWSLFLSLFALEATSPADSVFTPVCMHTKRTMSRLVPLKPKRR